jgi:hypothetical protein
MLASCNNKDEKRDEIRGEINQNSSIVKTETEKVEKEYESISEIYQTEDKKKSAQIIRLKGEEKDTLRITTGEEVLIDLPLEEGISQILSVEWLNNNQYLAITSHFNPSMNQYLTVDFQNDFQMENYFGFGFTWNSEGSNFYYIQAASHFSEDTTDVLVDKKGNVFYETKGGNRLIGWINITPNEKYFVCEIYTSDDKSNLLILEKQDEQTMVVVAQIIDSTGIPAFIDNETLTLTEDGKVQTFLINDLIN